MGIGFVQRQSARPLVSVFLLIPLGVYQGAPIVEFNHGYLQGLNHNVLQYPLWIFIPLVTLYATRPLSEKARQSFWWLVLGILLGIGFWTKISIGILYGTLLAWTLIDREARQHYKTIAPYLALLVCLTIGAKPLYYGLLHWHDMALYVVDKAHYIADFDRISEVVVIFASMMAVAVLARGISKDTRLCYPFVSLTRRMSHFLLLITLMPFAILVMIAAWLHIEPAFSWTLPMYGLWGVVLVAIMRPTWRVYSPHVMLLAAVVLLFKPVYYYPLAHGFYPQSDNHWVVSEKIMDEWNAQTHNAPLTTIYGNIGRLAGVVALYARADAPQSIFNGEVTKEHNANGALLLSSDGDWQKDSMRLVMKKLQLPEQTMAIDQYPHVIYYAILPPIEK